MPFAEREVRSGACGAGRRRHAASLFRRRHRPCRPWVVRRDTAGRAGRDSQWRHRCDAARGGTAAVQCVASPVRSSRQGWIGIRRDGVMKMASRKEVVEAKIANKLLFAGELSYRDAFEASRHALRLSCSKEEL